MMLPQYKVDDIKILLAELCNVACINTDAYDAESSDFTDDQVRKFCEDVMLVLNGEIYDSE